MRLVAASIVLLAGAVAFAPNAGFLPSLAGFILMALGFVLFVVEYVLDTPLLRAHAERFLESLRSKEAGDEEDEADGAASS